MGFLKKKQAAGPSLAVSTSKATASKASAPSHASLPRPADDERRDDVAGILAVAADAREPSERDVISPAHTATASARTRKAGHVRSKTATEVPLELKGGSPAGKPRARTFSDDFKNSFTKSKSVKSNATKAKTAAKTTGTKGQASRGRSKVSGKGPMIRASSKGRAVESPVAGAQICALVDSEPAKNCLS